MRGTEIVLDAFEKEGVDVIFGYPGGVVIPLFDELYTNKKLKIILTRHEQAAAHAVDGYARSTGKVGVGIFTSGPGATNAVTGIATAALDSVPLVLITGQVKNPVIGTDAFQEANMTGITSSITKHNYLVKDIKDLPRILKEAFHIAQTGRPGPVLIDLPVDISTGELEDYVYPKTVNLEGYNPNVTGSPKQIKRLADAIAKAKKPVLYTGGGIIASNASTELRAFIKKTNMPVVTTLMGLGTVKDDTDVFLGMPGMHGTVAANLAITESDLLIGLGVRFDDRVTGKLDEFAVDAVIAHIDIDPAEISKNIEANIPVVGDAKQVLEELNKIVKTCKINPWLEQTAKWKKDNPLTYKQGENQAIKPQHVIQTVNKMVPEDTIITTEVGQHQMWVALFYKFMKPRTFLTSGGLGTMGFGFPSAMGAKMANPKKTVVCFAGDGSFQMNLQELTTCALNGINVKVIVLNNQYLGMVRQWQEFFWDKRYASTCLTRDSRCPKHCSGPGSTKHDCPAYLPDFVKLAEACGVFGVRTARVSDLEETLKKGFEHDGPAIIEIAIEKEENILPMVPSGRPINEIIKPAE